MASAEQSGELFNKLRKMLNQANEVRDSDDVQEKELLAENSTEEGNIVEAGIGMEDPPTLLEDLNEVGLYMQMLIHDISPLFFTSLFFGNGIPLVIFSPRSLANIDEFGALNKSALVGSFSSKVFLFVHWLLNWELALV